MGLLQTLAVDYAELGEPDEGKQFFALNISQFVPELESENLGPQRLPRGP